MDLKRSADAHVHDSAPRCGVCHSDLDVTSRWYIEIHPDEWPLALNFVAIVICSGELLELPRLGSFFLSLLATVPVFVRFAARLHCERCEVDLEEPGIE